jgi:hypothetical protein
VKRLIACVSLVAVATTAAVPSTAPTKSPPKAASAAKRVAKAVPKCKFAPADEYFGKLKLSILGIRNTIKDQGLKIDVDPAKAPSTFNAIALTEDAIRDWQHKYPCDSWLPGTLYALQRFYLKIHTQDGVKHVHATFKWLRHDFPKSKLVAAALKEDGQASAAPSASGGSSSDAGPAAVPSAAPSAGPNPFGVQGTPIPGTAPASVINAQNAMASPSPRPH